MSPRTLFTAVLLTALPFAAVACGDDEPSDDAADSTTTTAAESTDTTAGGDAGDDDPTGTTDPSDTDQPFAEGLAEARTRLEEASTICDLADLSTFVEGVGQPTGPEEVQAAVEFQAGLWHAIADSASDEFAAEAEVIRGVAESFPTEAEGVAYDFAAIGQLESINAPEFNQALNTFYEETVEKC